MEMVISGSFSVRLFQAYMYIGTEDGPQHIPL